MISAHNSSILQTRLSKHTYDVDEGDTIKVPLKEIIYKGKHLIDKLQPNVGQRITSIAPNGPVPFGTTGTVIGYDSEFHEFFVVADQVFELGSNLRKRLKEQRGFVCKAWDAVLYDYVNNNLI